MLSHKSKWRVSAVVQLNSEENDHLMYLNQPLQAEDVASY